jgi:transcriptional regulator with XRE-family HTH domain
MGPDLLKNYLSKHDESQRHLERRLGAKTGAISRYLSGDRVPGGRWAFAIESATGGAVPAASWWVKPSKSRAA